MRSLSVESRVFTTPEGTRSRRPALANASSQGLHVTQVLSLDITILLHALYHIYSRSTYLEGQRHPCSAQDLRTKHSLRSPANIKINIRPLRRYNSTLHQKAIQVPSQSALAMSWIELPCSSSLTPTQRPMKPKQTRRTITALRAAASMVKEVLRSHDKASINTAKVLDVALWSTLNLLDFTAQVVKPGAPAVLSQELLLRHIACTADLTPPRATDRSSHQ